MIESSKQQVSTKPLSEVLFEFRYFGPSARVVAIDPNTNTEVSIVGASRYARETLKNIAVRKLEYVLAKKQKNR